MRAKRGSLDGRTFRPSRTRGMAWQRGISSDAYPGIVGTSQCPVSGTEADMRGYKDEKCQRLRSRCETEMLKKWSDCTNGWDVCESNRH